MSGRRGKGDGKAQVISFTSTDGDDDTDLSAIIGKALGIQTRPPGAKSALELRAEFGVSRSIMQRTLKKLVDSGQLERRKVIERDATGRPHQNIVYVRLG
jgi:response regulator of citrate/malate metabolism